MEISSDISVPFLLATLTFIVICLLSLGLMIYLRQLSYQRGIVQKLREGNDEWTESKYGARSVSLSEESSSTFISFLSAIGGKAKGAKTADDTETKIKFLRAGLRGRNVATVFWGTKLLLAVVAPMIFLVFSMLFFPDMKSSTLLLSAIFLALLGMLLPDVWLRFKAARRKDRLIKAFPDALDLLVICVEAGMGLDAAIHRVGEELSFTHPELSDEFKLLNLEIRAGKSRPIALKNLGARTAIDEVNSLVSTLLQTDRFGTSVAQALRVYSDTFRTARYQRAEEIAAKIGTKLIFPLVLFLFPSFFVVALGPAGIQVYRMFFAS